jgi:hypothetical protein
MWEYLVNQLDEIRRAYLKRGPYQLILQKEKYPLSGLKKHPRRFQASYNFQLGSSILLLRMLHIVYHVIFFSMKALGRLGWDVFTIKGFRSWKNGHDGKNCTFLTHIGEDPCSPHNNAVKYCEDLRNQSRHIDKVLNAQSIEQILNNRIHVKTSINVAWWLAFQGCTFRNHDETLDSFKFWHHIMIKLKVLF